MVKKQQEMSLKMNFKRTHIATALSALLIAVSQQSFAEICYTWECHDNVCGERINCDQAPQAVLVADNNTTKPVQLSQKLEDPNVSDKELVELIKTEESKVSETPKATEHPKQITAKTKEQSDSIKPSAPTKVQEIKTAAFKKPVDPVQCLPVKKKTIKPIVEKNFSKAEKQPEFNPLEVSEATTERDVKPRPIDLPGVIHLDGEATDSTKFHRIFWGSSGIEPIMLSVHGSNLITLPFNDPYIVSNSYLDIQKRATNNNIYVTFNYPEGVKPFPLTIYVENPKGGMPIGLQLIPKDIPQQQYVIVDDTQNSQELASRESTEYITRIQSITETVALGRNPAGYSVTPLDYPPIVSHGLLISHVTRMSNSEGDIHVYDVENPSDNTIYVKEDDFDSPNVLAVSITPKPSFKKNEAGKVIVFSKKETK